jgi:hypothetical protein
MLGINKLLEDSKIMFSNYVNNVKKNLLEEDWKEFYNFATQKLIEIKGEIE